MKIKFSGLSLKWNNLFIRNLVIVIGVVLVWRGVWNIAETYLLPNYPTISSIISIAIGVLILYLPDELKQLGGYEDKEIEKIEEATISIREMLKKMISRIKGIFGA